MLPVLQLYEQNILKGFDLISEALRIHNFYLLTGLFGILLFCVENDAVDGFYLLTPAVLD